MGIEALSRGAASALFIESDRAAVATIESNLSRTKLPGRVRQRDVFDFLRQPLAGGFDIIFADPPYERTASGDAFTALLMSSAELAAMLEPAGTFVLEKRPSEPVPATALWRIVRRKAYGATEVLFLNQTRLPFVHSGDSDDPASL